jgi:hypothetical protein
MFLNHPFQRTSSARKGGGPGDIAQAESQCCIFQHFVKTEGELKNAGFGCEMDRPISWLGLSRVKFSVGIWRKHPANKKSPYFRF